MDVLKAKRIAVSSRLTHIKRYIAEDDVIKVRSKYEELKESFRAFEAAYELQCSETSDDNDKAECERYFQEVLDSYTATMMASITFIKENEKCALNQISTVSTHSLKLPPPPQPDVFTGSSEAFPLWKASFKTLIDAQHIEPEQKMFFLRKYTGGEARNAIESLFLIPSASSYLSAMSILEERFGSSTLVTAAFRNRLESWSKIGDKDSQGLQRFSDYLQQLVTASTKYSSLRILDDEFENRKMVQKLPSWLAAKWIEQVVNQVTFPSFSAFASFIRDRAKIANHSLWGERNNSSKFLGDKQVPHHKVLSTKADSSLGRSARLSCPLCKGPHSIQECRDFKSLSLKDRRSVIFEHKLCYGCLGGGHRVADCRSKETCSICQKNHPSLLHDFSVKSDIEQKE